VTIGPWWTDVEPFVIADWVRYVIEPNSEGPLRAATQGIIWSPHGDSTARICIQWPNLRGIEISETEDRSVTRGRALRLGRRSSAARRPLSVGHLVVRGVGNRSFEFEIDGMTARILAERVAPITTAVRRAELASHLGLQTRPNDAVG
jgi:hypothetical protein